MALALRRGLEADGYAVDVAGDGETGVWMARENAYDAIVLDILLPKLNGYQVCTVLRSEQVRTPILMLTAKHGEFDEAEALDSGADDFMSKPFSFVVLEARLRALLRRGSELRPVVMQAGDLGIDPARRRAWRGDTSIELTAREFAILEMLLREKGHVVTKRSLLEHVWNFDFEGDVNIVEVYISSLRKKVDAPFGTGAIETVRGAGYRLAPDGGRR